VDLGRQLQAKKASGHHCPTVYLALQLILAAQSLLRFCFSKYGYLPNMYERHQMITYPRSLSFIYQPTTQRRTCDHCGNFAFRLRRVKLHKALKKRRLLATKAKYGN